MQFKWPDFKSFPASVRNGVLLLWGGWALHFCFYFFFYLKHFTDLSPREMYLQIGVGIGICYFVAIVKKWARMLSLFFNLGIFAIHGAASFRAFASQNNDIALITGATAAPFCRIHLFFIEKRNGALF